MLGVEKQLVKLHCRVLLTCSHFTYSPSKKNRRFVLPSWKLPLSVRMLSVSIVYIAHKKLSGMWIKVIGAKKDSLLSRISAGFRVCKIADFALEWHFLFFKFLINLIFCGSLQGFKSYLSGMTLSQQTSYFVYLQRRNVDFLRRFKIFAIFDLI